VIARLRPGRTSDSSIRDPRGSGRAVLGSLGVKNPFGVAPPAWPPRPDTVEIPKIVEPEPVPTLALDPIPLASAADAYTQLAAPTGNDAPSPRPISVEVSLPSFGDDQAGETDKLMNHIRGLLKQLGDREEQILHLNTRISELESRLDDKDRLIGELMAGKTLL
jgi:hypothetical protein